jgi:uncharacterized protein
VANWFEWDEGNRAHVAEHGLSSAQCEEAFADPHRVAVPAGEVRGEHRAAMIGRTEAGRLIVVIYTFRIDRIRVVTAYPADRSDARAYREANQ